MADRVKYDKVTHGWVTQTFVDGECVEQTFFEGEEYLIRRENEMGDEIEVDVKSEKPQDFNMVQPNPVEIESVIRDGELNLDPKKNDVDDAIDQCCSLMDSACTWEILGTPLFRAKNGRFYTIELEAMVREASLQCIEEEIDQLLALYVPDEGSLASLEGHTKACEITDDKVRVNAKMDLYNRLSALKVRLENIKKMEQDEQST